MIENTEELQGQLIATGNVIASMVAQKGNKGDKGDKGDTGAQGVPGQDGFSPSASVSKVGSTATITITDKDGTTTATISDGLGDMLKSVYDTDDDGIVDNAEKVNNHTVLSDVPADAVFTYTTYTAGTNVSISSGNVISATDTTYTAGAGIDITGNVISNTQTSAEWGNITGTLSNQTDLNTALGNKADSSSLATVATSGSYADLSNTPTIPTKISDLTNDSDFIEKSNTAGLVKNDGTIDTTSYSTFSGSYNDLSNKPTIPDELADLTDDSTHRVVTDTEKTTWSGKQDALVSGTNIKTINSTSLLGSGDIELGTSIPIQNTAPLDPQEDDLWIDTSEPEEMQEAIVNEYSESTSETYSCDYINNLEPVVLFESNAGEGGNITLSDSAANYSKLEVLYNNNDTQDRYSAIILNPNGYTSVITRPEVSATAAYIWSKPYTINGTAMNKGTARLIELPSGTISAYDNGKIFKVVGYK